VSRRPARRPVDRRSGRPGSGPLHQAERGWLLAAQPRRLSLDVLHGEDLVRGHPESAAQGLLARDDHHGQPAKLGLADGADHELVSGDEKDKPYLRPLVQGHHAANHPQVRGVLDPAALRRDRLEARLQERVRGPRGLRERGHGLGHRHRTALPGHLH